MSEFVQTYPVVMYYNDWLTRRALYTGDRVAVTDTITERSISYAELNRRATAVAAWLRDHLKIVAGDRVACVSLNSLEYLTLYFACGKIGCVLVPLNTRLPDSALEELCKDCTPSTLICDEPWLEFGKRMEAEANVRHTIPMQGDGIAAISENSTHTDFEPHTAEAEEIAMILYTSGTTGKSKGAMISWRQIHWNAINTTIGLSLAQEDVSFLHMPLYHTGGWHVLFTPLMHLGGRVVLQQQFDPAVCNELVASEGITILFGIPTTMGMMHDAPNFDEADFSSVRFAICGGEPCPIPLLHAYQEKGVPVRQGYGLTEAGPNCFSLPAEDALRKEGSVGFPNFHIETRIEQDNGSEAGPDEVGELLMRGPHVFSGYWNNPEASAETLTDGWVRTGDLFRRDAEGYHTVVGRKKDMFISGGENVYPAHVERILQQHPAIAQVAVVGMPHPKWGETGCACVVLKAGETLDCNSLRDWAKPYLAAFQSPHHLIQLESLPLGHSGKVDKRLLEKLAKEAR